MENETILDITNTIAGNSETIEDIIETGIDIENTVSLTFLDNIINTITGNFRFILLGILFFYRVATLIRVIKDANARSNSFFLQFISALFIVLFTPIIGLPLYIAIRPQGRKRDKTPRREESFQNMQICGNCENICSINHACCTNCGEPLQSSCRECHKKYSNSYSYCPFCGAPHLDV